MRTGSPPGPGPGIVGRPGTGTVQHWEAFLPEFRVYDGELVSPVESLERYFRSGGTTVLRAAFEHSFFVHPDRVRRNTPLYPDWARLSREHYPGLDRGAHAMWQGREVKLGDNTKAQQAWARYAGRRIERASGYGVRHVWGHPWNPDAFTAGWNLCYMPFWAGMLTERQHPHPELEKAVRQAAWNLYFGDDPVCTPPDFVTDPGVDLDAMLDGQPILLIAARNALGGRRKGASAAASSVRTAGSAKYGKTLQDIVRDLMRTVLEDFPEALDGETIDLLENSRNPLGLKIGNHTLIRKIRDGTQVAGHGRYWTRPFGGRWYVCSQWWKDDHRHNAQQLAAWVETLVDCMEDAGARGRLLDIHDRLTTHGERSGPPIRD